MKIALIDNGSLEPASQRNLRRVAAGLAARTGEAVAAVSWKHSDRIPPAAIGGVPAWTLAPWVRAQLAQGERDFVFVPFFVSARGAIGSALEADLHRLAREAGEFSFRLTGSLAGREALAAIVAARVRETAAELGLSRPPVIVVDHGGPARASAELRDRVAADLAAGYDGPVAAASMESPGGDGFGFNRPLLAEQLRAPGWDRGAVVIAPLFLSPGRHAGADGDLARIARAAEAERPGLCCHFTGLAGTHPLAVEILADALRASLDPAPLLS
jgi:hypothetical protein